MNGFSKQAHYVVNLQEKVPKFVIWAQNSTFCERNLKQNLDCRPARLGAEENARQEWEKAYPEEPFQLSRKEVEERRDIWDKHKSDISYDLLGAALRQKVFFYQVGTQLILASDIHFRCKSCLSNLSKSGFATTLHG